MINDEQAAVCFGHLPPPPQPSRVASSSRDEAVFISKILITGIIQLLLLFIQLSRLCHKIMLVCHTF